MGPSDPVKRQAMAFDNVCRLVDDPDGELRKLLLGQRSVLL